MTDPTLSPPPAFAHQPPARTSTLAVLSLVFGIVTWVLLPFLSAIVAVVLGHMARKEIRQSGTPPMVEGDGLAIGGLVLGYAQLVLSALALIAVVVILVGLGHAAGHH